MYHVDAAGSPYIRLTVYTLRLPCHIFLTLFLRLKLTTMITRRKSKYRSACIQDSSHGDPNLHSESFNVFSWILGEHHVTITYSSAPLSNAPCNGSRNTTNISHVMMIFKHPRNKTLGLPPQQALLPTLPLELREQIYDHVTSPRSNPIIISAADFIYGHDPCLPYFLPRLCHVNEATRVDVGLWYLRSTEFSLLYPQHIEYFANFLNTFEGESGSTLR